MESSVKRAKRASGEGAELSEVDLHWPAHVSVIAAIPQFQRGIRARKGLTQPPPAGTEAKLCMDTTITHRTTAFTS